MFGLFWILGYRFSPRLADIGGARFWRIDRNADYDAFDRLARNQIDTERIAAAWPDLLRLAGSLELGRVKADAVMRILQVKERPTPLARALAELGRIVKTIHVLDHVNDDVTDGPSSNRMRLVSKRGDFERNHDGSAQAARRPRRPSFADWRAWA